MPPISRQRFLQNFSQGIPVNSPDLAQTMDAAALAKLKALDVNGDGVVKGEGLAKAWTVLDSFDNDGSPSTLSSTGKAGDLYRALEQAARSPTDAATAAGTTAATGVATTTSPRYSEAIAKAALDRAAADPEGYAVANAPTSPYKNLSGNKVPGETRPSWLQDKNKCNQFVGDALTQAGMKMPTFKMADGTEHYMNAEKLPQQRGFFDRITDPKDIRPGDIFVLDYPARGESTAHTEVITGYDPETGIMKTTGAHHGGAYEVDRGAWLSQFTYDTEGKRWSTSDGDHLYILRPKKAAVTTTPVRG